MVALALRVVVLRRRPLNKAEISVCTTGCSGGGQSIQGPYPTSMKDLNTFRMVPRRVYSLGIRYRGAMVGPLNSSQGIYTVGAVPGKTVLPRAPTEMTCCGTTRAEPCSWPVVHRAALLWTELFRCWFLPWLRLRHMLTFHHLPGVHFVFDTAFARNFSLLESQREFVQRFRGQTNSREALPMLASACPGMSVAE